MVDLRRLFHAHPETAFTELWTSATTVAELRRLGYRVRTGPEAIDLSGVPALPDRAEPARAADRARAWGAGGRLGTCHPAYRRRPRVKEHW